MTLTRTYPMGTLYRIPYNDFVGAVIGHYTRLDGQTGVVLQQEGTKVVHVSSEKWLEVTDRKIELPEIPYDFAAEPMDGTRFRIEADGFVGTIIGRYVRTDGRRGVVMQFDGTKILHVYGLRWLVPADGDAVT